MADITIVIPVFNEEKSVDQLLTRLGTVTDGLNHRFAFLIVDDGSTDGTLDRLIAWQSKDSRLSIVRLSRNWGQQNAYNAGLDHAESFDAVILMDGDLEDPPEVIPSLIACWENGFEVVNAVKDGRVASPLRKLMFALYHKTMSIASEEVDFVEQAGMLSLMDARVAAQLKLFFERNKSYPNLRAFIGFKQTTIPYKRERRLHGQPKQTTAKLLRDGFNALFSFSYLPLRLMSLTGLFLCSLFVFLSVAVLVLRITGWKFWIFQTVPGWTSLVLLILLVSSFNLLFLGILGEYVARIYDEARQRPYYIVDRIYRGNIGNAGAHAARQTKAETNADEPTGSS